MQWHGCTLLPALKRQICFVEAHYQASQVLLLSSAPRLACSETLIESSDRNDTFQ